MIHNASLPHPSIRHTEQTAAPVRPTGPTIPLRKGYPIAGRVFNLVCGALCVFNCARTPTTRGISTLAGTDKACSVRTARRVCDPTPHLQLGPARESPAARRQEESGQRTHHVSAFARAATHAIRPPAKCTCRPLGTIAGFAFVPSRRTPGSVVSNDVPATLYRPTLIVNQRGRPAPPASV